MEKKKKEYQRPPVQFSATVHSGPEAKIQATHSVSAHLPFLLGEHNLGTNGSRESVTIALLKEPPRLAVSGGIIGDPVEVPLPRNNNGNSEIRATKMWKTGVVTVVFPVSELNSTD